MLSILVNRRKRFLKLLCYRWIEFISLCILLIISLVKLLALYRQN